MSRKNRARSREFESRSADAEPETALAVAPEDNDDGNAPPALHGILAHPPGPDDNLTGDYLLWLTDDCPVHSAVVAGIDIPRFVDLHTFACPDCNHRFLPAQGAAPTCPPCAARGRRVAAALDGRSPARRARKRMRLSDARVRELRARLDPDREVQLDARGRRLDGPRTIRPGQNGESEQLLAPFVRIVRVDDAGGADDPESIVAALERRRMMQRMARAAEHLAADEAPPPAERARLRAEIERLVDALDLHPRAGESCNSR